MFIKIKLQLLKICLYKENLRYMSTLVIGAYLKQFNKVGIVSELTYFLHDMTS